MCVAVDSVCVSVCMTFYMMSSTIEASLNLKSPNLVHITILRHTGVTLIFVQKFRGQGHTVR